MKTIGELLSRDLSRKIEEIIKVDQHDEQSVHFEITEYVATDAIRNQYRKLLKAIAEAPAEPTEGIGVWVSGFFGSGKSSFAKMLGYVLSNRSVLGKTSSELFKHQVEDTELANLIDFINTKIPTEVIMFDVSVDRAVRKATERIAEVMYTVLLRELDYAEDYDIAELEIELESESKLTGFVSRCNEMFAIDWRTVRKGAQKISRASAILNSLDPKTYPTSDSWSQSLRNKSADITVGKFVERAFELTARRRPGKAIVFIIDEVGQYVARSADKIEDLRAVVEQFGKAGKNLLREKKIIAPAWIVVTSQEKLDEVVAALDSKRVELAKLQDRFKHRIDFAPTDIREVASKRVLSKKATAIPVLKKLYQESQGQLNAACRLERTARKSDITESDFVQFYPYLPHYLELSIDIMSGIRLQPGAPRHLGGSNRTIIKQTYEMLVSERTDLARKPIGTLVTMDRIFELVEGNLADEKKRDIGDIRQRFKDDSVGDMAVRVAKAICLLEFVRDLPRTESNIAALLVDQVGKPTSITEVKEALQKLIAADFIILKEGGYELLTPTDKNWQKEKKGHLDPKPRDRNEIIRSIVDEIFSDPKLKTYRFRDIKNFKVGVTVNGVPLGESGQIPLSLQVADDPEEYSSKLTQARDESRQDSYKDEPFWVVALTAEIDELVAGLYASREMVKKYNMLSAQSRVTTDEAACLQNEKNESLRLESRLRDKLSKVLVAGTGFFRGVSKEGSSLGSSIEEIFKKLFDYCAPQLYPKLELGAKPLRGNEAEEILKATNLKGLSQVFYDGGQGLNLVVKEGTQFVVNSASPLAKEILDYLNREHGYGNKDTRTGKAVENHFGGIGYGWDLDVLRVTLAALFRAGSIEISHGGRRLDSYQEPQSRAPFNNIPSFRATLFTPIRPPDLRALTTAVEKYEELTGKTVDVDKNAIAAALKTLVQEEEKELIPVQAVAKAHLLPVTKPLEEYRTTIHEIIDATADECVQKLVGEWNSIKESRLRLRKIKDVVEEKNIEIIEDARVAAIDIWPQLSARGLNDDLKQQASDLLMLLNSESFYESLSDIKKKGQLIRSAYVKGYEELHGKRNDSFAAAAEQVKGRAEWISVPEEMKSHVLASIQGRVCTGLVMNSAGSICTCCNATLAQLESDIVALSSLKSLAIVRVQEIVAPKDKVERVRLSEYFNESIDSEEAVERAIERLRGDLLKLVAEGVKIILE